MVEEKEHRLYTCSKVSLEVNLLAGLCSLVWPATVIFTWFSIVRLESPLKNSKFLGRAWPDRVFSPTMDVERSHGLTDHRSRTLKYRRENSRTRPWKAKGFVKILEPGSWSAIKVEPVEFYFNVTVKLTFSFWMKLIAWKGKLFLGHDVSVYHVSQLSICSAKLEGACRLAVYCLRIVVYFRLF